jgi:hypothetical protein
VHYQGQVTLSNGTPVSNIPVLVSGDAGSTFQSAGLTDQGGYYSGILNVPATSTYFLSQIISCTSTYVTHVLLWNGVDTLFNFPPLVYCNTANDTFTLCINAYVTDTNSLNDNYYAVYLIKSASTSNGDSLYLAGTDTIYTGEFACFENLTGTYYAKAMMLQNSSDFGNYVPTYQLMSYLWSNATPLNSNSMQYQNINMLQGISTSGPGFIGGLVSQGANRLAAENAVGDPIPGVDIILTNNNSQPIKHVKTDVNGTFSFSDLDYGTYKIWADVLNKPCVIPIVVTLSPDQNTVTNTLFTVASDAVYASFTNNQSVADDTNIFFLSGNPVHNELRIMARTNLSDVDIQVTDILGRIHIRSRYQPSDVITLNISELPNGTYSLRLLSENFEQLIRFVKM